MGNISFCRPTLTGNELTYIAEAIRLGVSSGDGPFTKKASKFMEAELGVKKVLLTTSCTHALEMTALLLDLKPGDEFIVPSFTFVSTANAFALRGARPIFIDVRPDTLNFDESQMERLITPRTKAIVPVHYAGVACEMDTILAIAEKHRIPVVEDNAHGLFGKYKGKYLGTLGAFGVQSFHETKNLTCGEGGALLVNDERYVERAEIIREKGTDRSKFFRGLVDKYGWVDLGSSYLMADLLAAFLLAQLENWHAIQATRQRIWQRYYDGLKSWAARSDVRLPTIPAACEHAYHMFYMILPTAAQRDALIKNLKERQILSVFHYVPLHTSPMGKKFGGTEGACPVTEDLSLRLVRLPFFNSLAPDDQDRVISAVIECAPS